MPDVPTVEYKVKKGDNLWNIVKAAGFPAKDWEKIYRAPYNEKFRKLRPDPNIIQPGDVFVLPKYNGAEMGKIAIRMMEAESKLAELAKKRLKLQGEIKKLLKEREPDLKKIEQLKKEAKALEQLADDAANECSDQWSCLGAGAISQKFSNKAKAARREIESIKKNMDIKGTKKALEKMDKLLVEAGKEEDRVRAELKKLIVEFEKANKVPY